MEPFIVADTIVDNQIYKTTQAESHASGIYTIYLTLFYNVEQDLSLSVLKVPPQESYLIPANTYYTEEAAIWEGITSFTGRGQTVRWVNLRNVPDDGTSVRIPNLNVRAYYE